MIPEHNFHRVRTGEREISRLAALGLYYGFGGGRNCGPHPCGDYSAGQVGGDCSWLVLRTCYIMGLPIKNWLGSTYSLAEEGSEGKGKLFTIHVKNPPDPHEAHTIMEFHHPGHDRGAECGGSDNPHPRGGPSWFRPSAERIAEFPIKRHFKGF
jgi:hypothetical protein